MARVLLHDVHVTAADNTVTILKAGTQVPAELEEFVTNPKAYALEVVLDLEREESGEGEETDEKSYSELKGDELRELLKARELPTSGTNAELIERLEFDDLEREESGEGEENQG